MSELHEELVQFLTRPDFCGVTGAAQSLSRGRRCSHALSSSQALSPLVDSRRREVAKQSQGDSMMRHLWPRSRAQQPQSQLPGCQLPSEAPPWASPRRTPQACPTHTDKQLHCSLSKLQLQPQQRESVKQGVSQMQPDSTPMHATGHPHSLPGAATKCSPPRPSMGTSAVQPHR